MWREEITEQILERHKETAEMVQNAQNNHFNYMDIAIHYESVPSRLSGLELCLSHKTKLLHSLRSISNLFLMHPLKTILSASLIFFTTLKI